MSFPFFLFFCSSSPLLLFLSTPILSSLLSSPILPSPLLPLFPLCYDAGMFASDPSTCRAPRGRSPLALRLHPTGVSLKPPPANRDAAAAVTHGCSANGSRGRGRDIVRVKKRECISLYVCLGIRPKRYELFLNPTSIGEGCYKTPFSVQQYWGFCNCMHRMYVCMSVCLLC